MSARVRSTTPAEESSWWPSVRGPGFSQSLERGLAVLGVFTPTRPVLGIADIAHKLGMSRPTTHRYAATLVALGYLEQDAGSRKYRLGLRVTDLYLEGLSQRTSYTTSLGVLDGGDVLYVDRVRSLRRRPGEVELELHTGSRVPAYCTAMGKLLLASLPAPEQRDLIRAMKLAKRGPHTITRKKALREELEQIRATGFAASDQEMAAERYAIAAPVRNEAREIVAAVHMAAHSSVISLEELVDALGPHLVATADQISARLGYRRDGEIPNGR
jgi:IclR family pca regulon transcriptional regulator